MFNNIWPKLLKQDDVIRWLAFSLIALAVFIFYFQVFSHPPRADQVVYLAETSNKQNPLDLIFGCYDLNRHRTIAPGDELLFRPLVYMLLGSEQVVFGHHFWAWQLLGLLAHLTLIWVLLRLLWRLSGPWLAFAGAWFFALSVVNYESVSWTHLSSYMFMMACIVGVIEQMVFCFEDNEVPWDRIKRILIYSFIACFTYETANIFVLLVTGALIASFPRMKRRILALTIPVILYGFFSYFNYMYLNHITRPIPGATNGILIGNHVWAVVRVTFWWLYEGLFDGLYRYVLGIRTMFSGDEVMVFKPLVLNNLQVILGLIILAVFLGLAWINRRQFFKRIKLLIVLLGMVFSYVTVIVVGRYNDRDLLDTVRINLYYLYIFWAIIVIIALLLISTKERKTKLQRWLMIIFVTASFASGLWQGKEIYDMATRVSRVTHNQILLVRKIDSFIQEKKFEPDFSFYVDPSFPGNYSYGLADKVRKADDPPDKVYSFVELLYLPYFRPLGVARYVLLEKSRYYPF